MLLNDTISSVEGKNRIVSSLADKNKYLAKHNDENYTTFAQQVILYCEMKGIKNGSEFSFCTFVDREIYHRLKHNSDYIPTERIAYTICFGLKLTIAESSYLLSKARYTIIPTNPNDMYRELLVEMLATGKNYIPDCNKELKKLNFQLLGSLNKDGELKYRL